MHTVTTKISDSLHNILSELSNETSRSRGYIIQRAIENYLEEKSDILIALSRIERGEEVISFEEAERKYDLED
jgi:predicted DNA-binding protein